MSTHFTGKTDTFTSGTGEFRLSSLIRSWSRLSSRRQTSLEMDRGPEEVKLKVCMVGDAAVGKTSLVRRFVLDQFNDEYLSTFGAKVMTKDVPVENDSGEKVILKLLIWDIMGETSTLDKLGESYFRGAQGIVAVCDITRYTTLENLPVWFMAVEAFSGEVPAALAVNKIDLKDKVIVVYEDHLVKQYASDIGAKAYMTSARTGENVEEMFKTLAIDVYKRVHSRKVAPLPS